MPGIDQTWDFVAFAIKLADKIADKVPKLEYAVLLPDLVRAAVGINQVPAELLDMDKAESEELRVRGEGLATDLKLGNETIYADIDDGLEIVMAVKSIVLRHIEAKQIAAENDSTKSKEPTA